MFPSAHFRKAFLYISQDYYAADWTEEEQAEGKHLAVMKFVRFNPSLLSVHLQPEQIIVANP